MYLKKFTLLFLLILSISGFSQGILKIKVTDDNNLNLPGASVVFTDVNIKGITDEKGELVLSNLPFKTYKLSLTYLGYKTKDTSIVVASKLQLLGVKLISGVSTLKGVLVLGDRLKGQAKALNQQKNGVNIGNVISADQIGRFPDANLGDALKRVPGVTMQNDQGEARDIIIRGLAPQFNSVTLNGDRLPSAEGDNRRVQMDLIPSDMVQTVVVNKTITADMEPDAIGGSVNLITRSAPSKFRFSGTTSLGYNAVRGGQLANAALIIGGRLFKNKLGIIVSGNINDNVYGSDNVEAVWSKTAKNVAYVSQQDIRVYDVRRIRRSLQTTIDYKIDNKNTIIISGMYNWRDDWENRYRFRMRDIAPTLNATGDITGFRGRARIETKGGIDNNRVRSTRLEDQRVKQASIKGEHLFNNGLKVNWTSSYAEAGESRPNERYFDFQNSTTNVVMDITDSYAPNVKFAVQPALSAFTFRRLWELNGATNETDWNNKLNFTLPLKLFKDLKTEFKFGGRFARKTKERVTSYTQYNRTAATTAALANLSTVTSFDATNAKYLAGSKYAAGNFVDAGFLGRLDLYNTANFTAVDVPAEYLTGNYNATENIWSGYGTVEQQITKKLSVHAGLRFENTYLNYTANVLSNNTVGGKINVRPESFKNILPSILFKYNNAANDVVIRASFSATIARPNFFDLAPYLIINPSDKEIRSGNANLRPTVSNNLDVMFEKYFKSVGILSGGVFYKKLNNFIYTLRDNNYNTAKFSQEYPSLINPIPTGESWIYSKPFNGDNLSLYGFEVAIQRQLDFLPGAWKGLGVYLNYTYTKSEGSIYTPSGIERKNVTLPGTAPHMINASLSWENKKFLARVAMNYTASYLDELGNDEFNDRFYDKQLFLDFNMSYTITPKWRWFFEMTNITNQPLRYYQGVKERTMQVEYYRERWNTGLKFDLF